MQNKIKLLPDSVANQIAAGEVVQRPASVVKELFENAIDAGATSVIISVRDGGKDLIQVVDNGCGMSPADAVLAFERHATSKISKATDLYSLNTFGFRGEALASIASVAEVELRTRREEDELGVSVVINGGHTEGQTPVNVTRGAQFSIKNLFYNIPARRKFLKSTSSETKAIVDEVQRVALCNPGVEVKFYNNDTLQYSLPSANLRGRIVGVMGKSINQHLLDIAVDTSIISIKGFIGSPESANKSSKQFLFVNGRYFRSGYFHKSIVQAYDRLIQSDVQPSYFLHLTVDTSRIDVNIHPSKTEIKFEDEQAIWQILNAAVRETLGRIIAVPTIDFDNDSPIDIPVLSSSWDYKEPEVSLNPDFNPFEEEGYEVKTQKSSRGNGSILHSMSYAGSDGIPEGWEVLYKNSYDAEDRVKQDGDTFRDFIASENSNEVEERFIKEGFSEVGSDEWEVIDSDFQDDSDNVQSKIDFLDDDGERYLEDVFDGKFLKISERHVVITYGGQMIVVDLTRAFRRVTFERIFNNTELESSVNQQNMFPEEIELTPDDYYELKAAAEDFLKVGFDVRVVGEHRVALYGVPSDVSDVAPELLINMLLDVLRDSDNSGEMRRRRVAMAATNSICAAKGRNFVDVEIKNILSLLLSLPDPMYTPDGRNVMVVFTIDELSKRF